MRWSLLPLVLAVLLAPIVPAPSHPEHVEPPLLAPPSIEPAQPSRGQDIHVSARLESGIQRVILTHCRVEPSYACSIVTVEMDHDGQGLWTGTIPWQTRFFEGSHWVGYNLMIEFDNGTEQTLPSHNTPLTPPGLPDGSGTYFFFAWAQTQDTPAAGLLALAAAVGIAGGLRRVLHRP